MAGTQAQPAAKRIRWMTVALFLLAGGFYGAFILFTHLFGP